MLLEVLAPIAEAELVHGQAIEAWLDRGGPYSGEPGSDFPEEDGPVYLLGGCALVDAIRATLGEDPLSEVLGELVPVLGGAAPGLDGQAAADALIGALAAEYRGEHPGDAEVLQRIGRPGFNPLETLVATGAVPPGDILPAGLQVLSALARLSQSGSASILDRPA